jgi:hypothetical protein
MHCSCSFNDTLNQAEKICGCRRQMIKWRKYGRKRPIPLAARFKAWFRGRLLSGIAGSNPAPEQGSLSVVIVVCCQVEVFASGLSFVQGSPTECGVSEYDREVLIMRLWVH